ncbi:MAG TPA: DUF4157 domain-containing protein [Candidatus Limnocylindrales bacterium]|nr:DUF4157 domain-containing protein [Candidatus Limnocylindrales bacterium]
MPILEPKHRPADAADTRWTGSDKHEREADAVAEHMDRAAPGFDFRNVKIHADGAACKPAGLLPGGGEALDHGIRGVMEPRLGFDLGGVRVHRGDGEPATTAATTALNARAFTVGRDIAFAPGEFRPETASGRRLLAHELTHVAQQTRPGTPLVQRQAKPDIAPWKSQIDDILSPKVGLLEDINRIVQLTGRFTTDELNDLIGLIHANPDAKKFTRDEAGVPGIFALQETRIGKRLDVAAARFLLDKFPEKRKTPRKSEETKAEVFSEDVVRDAYIRFHYNAILPGKDDPLPRPADLPDEVRKNCIAIIHALAPQLFTSPKVIKKIEQRFRQLRKKSSTHTIVHTGKAMAAEGVASAGVPTRFKDAKGKTTNGNTEPKTLESSPWDKVMDMVGNDLGWHIFAMSIMDGHHSVTLFVDNQSGGKEVYWADQWRIDPGDDFEEKKGSVSGFRQYEKAGFDKFIEDKTNEWWNDVHRPDSKCGKNHGKNWDAKCRPSATLMLWHLRKVPQK